jgi:Ohr subfamily peroxiredoxin
MATLKAPPLSLLEKYRGRDTRTLYSTTVTVTGGDASHGRASGIARSEDGNLDVHLRLPEALGGPGGGTNPEQLFAAGYAACFHGALSLLAEREGIQIPGSAVEVKVVLKAYTRIHLPGVARAIAEELVRNTERFCPYTKMARQGITNIVALVPENAADEQ